MFRNPNSKDENKHAWSHIQKFKKCNYLFSKLHSRFSFHLEDVGNSGNEKTFSWKTSSSPETIKLLWSLVERHESAITRKWSEVDDSNSSNLTRKLSATEFRTLDQFSDFVMRDDRILFLNDPHIPHIAAFFPRKAFSFALCCPSGLIDPMNSIANKAGKESDYALWRSTMVQKHPRVKILLNMNQANVAALATMAVFPMRSFEGDGLWDCFTTVFVPAFNPTAELGASIHCKLHLLGKLLFGPGYRQGGGFDLELVGYWFAIPGILLKADAPNPFVLRTCRSLRKLNRNSAKKICIEGSVTFSLRPVLVDRTSKRFLCTHSQTAGVLNFSSQPNAHI